MICGSATEKMRTSDFRRRTSAGLRGRCMRRPRGARVARSLKSEVGSHHLVIAQCLSPVRLFLTQSRRGAEAAELCVRIYGGPVPVESYDAKSRRVKKVTPNATTTFFYDGWNLVEERIAYADNATSTIRYYWGKDLSGTLQGAGGVGGLLYLTIDGVIYIPCYDNNGNITRYLNANGGTFARYSYDAFGKLIAKSGRRASFFRHRFSTKYYDSETGLYYYGYRFYHPTLMRWLNRDPIKEEGGVNLYGFCENKPIEYFDLFGMKIRSGVKPTKCSEADIDAAAKDVLLLAVRAMNADPPQSRLEHYGNLCCACKSGHYEVITTGPLSGEIQKSNGRKGTVRYIQETPVSDPRDPRISCPKGSTRVGYYHTHVYGDNFSKSDKELLYYQDHPYYMSRDGKRIVKAIPRITDDPAEANLPQDAVSDRGFALEPEVIILERGANE